MSVRKFLTTSSLTLVLGLFSHNTYAKFTDLKSFNENPGSLTASYFVPKAEQPSSNLVVLLHGCGQKGKSFAKQSGMLGLAKKHNFALLMPQQNVINNAHLCFNWHAADDYTKDEGESLSIKNMIMTLKQQLGSERVYIAGLSAGGAMASRQLVNYPELFNAGAVVAGVASHCADGLMSALSCMKNGPSQTAVELSHLVNKSNPQQKNWPKLSVWTGEKDVIVNPSNANTLAEQWATLAEITAKPKVENEAGFTISTWKNKENKVHVELVVVANLGHGIMVNPNEVNGGVTADYMLESPISTVKHVIDFWQLSSMN